MSMPTILIDARSMADPKGGGVSRAATYWLNDITDRRENRYICVTTGLHPSEKIKKFCADNNFEYHHIRLPNKLWTLLTLVNLTSLQKYGLKKFGTIDLILLPNIGFAGRLTVPYYLLLHDCSFAIEPRWFRWKMRLWHKLLPINSLIQRAERLYCVSEQTQKDASRLYNQKSEKFCLTSPMHQPIKIKNDQEKKPAWMPATAERFILLMGGSDPRKNIHTALKAISIYNINHPNKLLVPVVLGGKPHCTLAECSIPSVVAPHHITDDELIYLYKHAQALLYPSWYEGYGLPLHEIQQFNKVCLASTAGALPETAPPGTIFCHPAKPHEWLMALNLLEAG